MNYSARGCMYCEGSCNKECLPNQDIIKTEEDAKIFFEALENIPEPNDKLKKAFIDFGKQVTKKEKRYSEEDMIEAAKYGYNFHKTTSFPKQEFEDSCIRNTQQWLTTFKKK